MCVTCSDRTSEAVLGFPENQGRELASRYLKLFLYLSPICSVKYWSKKSLSHNSYSHSPSVSREGYLPSFLACTSGFTGTTREGSGLRVCYGYHPSLHQMMLKWYLTGSLALTCRSPRPRPRAFISDPQVLESSEVYVQPPDKIPSRSQ